jgi:hypothetical protein
MSTVVIRVDGVDVTDAVIIDKAEFTMQASGSPGTCQFTVRDDAQSWSFRVGSEITLDIDDQRMFGGYLMAVSRQYFFPVDYAVKPRNPCDPIEFVSRGLRLEGADYNILFRKRIVFDEDDPTDSELRTWPAGTNDDVIVKYLCANHLDLDGDGIDYESKVEHVGTANPDDATSPYGASQTWEEAMTAIAFNTGALYCIDAEKFLVYTDVDVANGPYNLSDVPNYVSPGGENSVFSYQAEIGDVFDIYAPSGETLSEAYDGAGSRLMVTVSGGIILPPGGETSTDVGYRDMELLRDGTKLVNDAMVWGAGQGSSTVGFVRIEDEDSIEEHGLWQWGDFREDMWRSSTIHRRASSMVYGSPQSKRGHKDDAISVNCTVKVPNFRVGQKVVFVSRVFGFTDVIPIRRQRITFVNDHEALYELTLSHYLDEPWNTMEFYLPPFGRPPDISWPPPVIVWPPPQDPDYPFCPLPKDAGILIFSDDFNRPTLTQPPLTSGGVWHIGQNPFPPSMTDGKFIGDGVQRTIIFDQVVVLGSILLAVDAMTGIQAFNIGEINVAATGLASISASYEYTTAAGVLTTASTVKTGTVPLATIQQPFYLRYHRDSALGNVGMRVWLQSEPEPNHWDILIDPTWLTPGHVAPNGTGYALAAIAQSQMAWRSTVRISGVDVYGLGTQASVGTLNSGLQGEGIENSWAIDWDNQTPDGGDGYIGNNLESDVVFDEQGSSGITTSLPEYSMVIHWKQFEAAPENAYLLSVHQEVKSFRVGQLVGGYTYEPPSRAWLTGEFSVGIGSGGITSGSPVPPPGLPFGVPVEFFVANYGDTPLGGTPFVYPFSVFGHVKDTVQSVARPDGGALIYAPFEMVLFSSDFVEGRLQWGVRIQDPEGLKSAIANAGYGGPFLLPNKRSATVSLQNVKFRAIWPYGSKGQTFCLPHGQGGTNLTRLCETQGIPGGFTGGPKDFATQRPYRPNSLEISLDGINLRSGFDFTEALPATGHYIVFSDTTNAREMRVCYFPG